MARYKTGMATYAVGDIQGCFASFERLLSRIGWGPGDRLWLAGDLVNRGPRSAEVLRFCRSLDERVVAVLGNHDLHLLAVHFGVRRKKSSDTVADVLAAPDRQELIEWLLHRPLLHVEGARALVHAGLWHGWSVDDAAEEARAVQQALQRAPEATLAALQKSAPDFEPALSEEQRWCAAAAIFTRLRLCDAAGAPHYDFSGPPESAPAGLVPWFDVPGRRSSEHQIVFGHWSALGLRVDPRVASLDTGCVWGRSLTALRLDDGAVFGQPAVEA